LLKEESVQKELKLTAEQLNRLNKLAEKRKQKHREAIDLAGDALLKRINELKDLDGKALYANLQPKQEKRLRQIVLQQEGADALERPEVATALELTADQRKEIAKVDEEVVTEFVRSRVKQPGDREPKRATEIIEEMAILTKAANEKKLKLLTSKQMAKWKELQGEPFTGELRRFNQKGGLPPPASARQNPK
jgi:hypothetical protein